MRISTCSVSSIFVLALLAGCGGGTGGGSNDSNPTSGGSGGTAMAGVGGSVSSVGGSTTTSGGSGAGPSTTSGGTSSTAGTTSTAGTEAGGSDPGGSGNGGGPPHVVADCDGLGEANSWEDITPPGVTNVLSVVADPVNAGTLYAGTAGTGIHKSTNCGGDWVKINTGTNADVIDSGGQWTMAIDPMEPDVLFAGSLYGSDPSLQKSTNGGVDWFSTAPQGSEIANTVDYNFFQEVSMDPTDHAHLVISFHAPCKGDYAPMCMAESTDSGETWRLFKGPIGGWGENARPLTLSSTSFLYVTWADGVYYTDDNGASWEKLDGVPGANHQLYLASDGTYYMGTYQGVFQSADGHAWAKIEGSPGGADGIVGDGDRLFTGVRDAGNQQPYFSAPYSGGTPWETLSSPNMAHGPVYLAYDGDHHLLYASNTESGLTRMVTK